MDHYEIPTEPRKYSASEVAQWELWCWAAEPDYGASGTLEQFRGAPREATTLIAMFTGMLREHHGKHMRNLCFL